MPIYEHSCPDCGSITESISSVDDRKDLIPCRTCEAPAKRCISSSQGIQRQEPLWLDSAVSNLADEAKGQINDRSDFNRYIKDNGIVQAG